MNESTTLPTLALLPTLAVTMGDPAGVGPELCLRLLQADDRLPAARIVVIGSAQILRRVAQQLNWSVPALDCPLSDWSQLPPPTPSLTTPFDSARNRWVLDVPTAHIDSIEPGQGTAASGQAAYAYVTTAIEAAQQQRVDAVTTGPLCKEALHLAGIHFPGHTEIFAERCGAKRWCMMQYSELITCSFVTVHVGYLEAVPLITPERVLDVIELTASALRRLRGTEPRLIVCGLNPHAGEHGLFGLREEERLIEPAIQMARQRGLQIEGPLPADTAFIPAKRARTDAYICMYHDQGHIPVKALAFDSAVNTTLGLNIIRTSVDHGTAFDIAWQGVADNGSLWAAVRLACQLAGQSSAPDLAASHARL
ncbi:MAG: 4-hydroxythreonine-4-phosphate dehydrogenase PdxA [Pirellulales bacterium]